jgi:heme/copper-type cytochrome/quinol oxidase subunit 3
MRAASTFFYRRPYWYLALLLVPPLLWFGTVYLGSLFALLWQSFYRIDDFTAQIVREPTLETYKQLVTQPANVDIVVRTLTMALAVRSAQMNNTKLTNLLIGLTLACACVFLAIKFVEYRHKFHEGLLPGKYFTAEGFHTHHAGIFFAVYFMMTGVHGLHILIGMGLMIWVLRRNMRGEFSSRYYSPIEGVGLYWHLVDLVWIYLFPLLYLIG